MIKFTTTFFIALIIWRYNQSLSIDYICNFWMKNVEYRYISNHTHYLIKNNINFARGKPIIFSFVVYIIITIIYN